MQKRIARALLALSLGAGACGRPAELDLGLAVDAAAAQALSTALAAPAGEEITVRGTVQEVCEASGCWFVLRAREGEQLLDLRVDLLPAGLAVDRHARGRTALVRGRLAGAGATRELVAQGLSLE